MIRRTRYFTVCLPNHGTVDCRLLHATEMDVREWVEKNYPDYLAIKEY